MDTYKRTVFTFLCGLLGGFVASKEQGWPRSCTEGEFMLVCLVQELMQLISDAPGFQATPLRDHGAWPHGAATSQATTGTRTAGPHQAIEDAKDAGST